MRKQKPVDTGSKKVRRSTEQTSAGKGLKKENLLCRRKKNPTSQI